MLCEQQKTNDKTWSDWCKRNTSLLLGLCVQVKEANKECAFKIYTTYEKAK